MNVTGTIPREFGELVHLVFLSLSQNPLEGMLHGKRASTVMYRIVQGAAPSILPGDGGSWDLDSVPVFTTNAVSSAPAQCQRNYFNARRAQYVLSRILTVERGAVLS